MNNSNYRQKNLLKDLIYLGQTKPVNKQIIKGLFKFALEPLLEAQIPKSVVMVRLFDSTELDSVLKRLEFTKAEVYSFDEITKGENLTKDDSIWGKTEFLVVLSPRYSACLLWDYTTENSGNVSCVYQLLNSVDVNNVIKIISQNSKIDLTRYTQEYTPERRNNELLNKAVHKFIDFANSFVEEAAMNEAQVGLLNNNEDIAKKYEYISTKAKLVSHDIKNHLSIIDLYTKIAEKRLYHVECQELKDSLTNAISSIKKSKEAIYSLVSEIRTIQGANLETLKLSKVLENTINLVSAKAQDEKIDIQVLNSIDCDILADEQKFLNVLINLLYNAIDALKENNAERIIKITTDITVDNMLKILINDNGCGIDEKNIPKLFDEGYTTKATGNGLGLYISKQNMQEQYGDLNLANTNKNGTTFEILIPKL